MVSLGAAIRIARLLGLDKLGSGSMPPPDPAFPPGSNSLKREIACRVWTYLVTLDRRASLEGTAGCSIAPRLMCVVLHCFCQDVLSAQLLFIDDTASPVRCDDDQIGAHIAVAPNDTSDPDRMFDSDFLIFQSRLARTFVSRCRSVAVNAKRYLRYDYRT